MNAIIIAAGSGKRINKNLKDVPKSMVKVNDKPIIEYQISILKQAGIDKIYVITGPYSEKFSPTNIEYIQDQNYESHDILGSLMEAKEFLKNDVLVLYSDIIFDLNIIQKMLDSKNDISIAVDMDWMKMYEGRTEHLLSEAENVKLDNSNKIIFIGKNIPVANNLVGEFLGIMKFSRSGADLFIKKYDDLVRTHTGSFHQASSFSKAYLTDLIQELIFSKINVEAEKVIGKWCEIDTIQDSRTAEKLFSN